MTDGRHCAQLLGVLGVIWQSRQKGAAASAGTIRAQPERVREKQTTGDIQEGGQGRMEKAPSDVGVYHLGLVRAAGPEANAASGTSAQRIGPRP